MLPKGTRRLLLAAFCAAAALSATAQNAQEQGLVITTQGGDQVILAVSDKPMVTFGDNSVIITTADKQLTYTLDDKVNIQFCALTGVGISPSADAKAIITATATAIKVTQAMPGSDIALYDTAGSTLARAKADAQGTASFRLAQKGTYIIRIANLSVKITN